MTIFQDVINALEVILAKVETRYGLAVDVVGKAQTIQEGIRLIEVEEPELVFLDIKFDNEPDDRNGFTVIDAFPDRGFNTVFTTAYAVHASEAVLKAKHQGFDFLSKPFSTKRLFQAILSFQENQENGGKRTLDSDLLAIRAIDLPRSEMNPVDRNEIFLVPRKMCCAC